MGLTERHLIEDEEPELTDRQLEDAIYEQEKSYKSGYIKGFSDAMKKEPVQPIYATTSHPFHIGLLYYCGSCHSLLSRDSDLFCRHCGKPIDWEKGAVLEVIK